MDLEAKKNILLSIIAATEQEPTIDHLITEAWQMEIQPVRSIVLKEGKEPDAPKQPRRSGPITIYGQDYRSLRFACKEVWDLTEREYNKVSYQVKAGVDVHDLLAPRREPVRKVLATDKHGVVK